MESRAAASYLPTLSSKKIKQTLDSRTVSTRSFSTKRDSLETATIQTAEYQECEQEEDSYAYGVSFKQSRGGSIAQKQFAKNTNYPNKLLNKSALNAQEREI